MSADGGAELVWFVMAFVLVGSALAAHRAPAGTLLRAALAWVVIFALLFLLVTGWGMLFGIR